MIVRAVPAPAARARLRFTLADWQSHATNPSVTINEARVVRDVIVVAASAGGIAALSSMLSQLDPSLAAGVAIAFHRSQMRDGMLPSS